MLTLELCLPLIVIVGCLLIGLVIDLKNVTNCSDKIIKAVMAGRSEERE